MFYIIDNFPLINWYFLLVFPLEWLWIFCLCNEFSSFLSISPVFHFYLSFSLAFFLVTRRLLDLNDGNGCCVNECCWTLNCRWEICPKTLRRPRRTRRRTQQDLTDFSSFRAQRNSESYKFHNKNHPNFAIKSI